MIKLGMSISAGMRFYAALHFMIYGKLIIPRNGLYQSLTYNSVYGFLVVPSGRCTDNVPV
jgi:hypothetical protein